MTCPELFTERQKTVPEANHHLSNLQRTQCDATFACMVNTLLDFFHTSVSSECMHMRYVRTSNIVASSVWQVGLSLLLYIAFKCLRNKSRLKTRLTCMYPQHKTAGFSDKQPDNVACRSKPLKPNEAAVLSRAKSGLLPCPTARTGLLMIANQLTVSLTIISQVQLISRCTFSCTIAQRWIPQTGGGVAPADSSLMKTKLGTVRRTDFHCSMLEISRHSGGQSGQRCNLSCQSNDKIRWWVNMTALLCLQTLALLVLNYPQCQQYVRIDIPARLQYRPTISEWTISRNAMLLFCSNFGILVIQRIIVYLNAINMRFNWSLYKLMSMEITCQLFCFNYDYNIISK